MQQNKKKSSKAWMVFGLAVVVSILLIGIGAQILFADTSALTAAWFYGFAILSFGAGVLVVLPSPEKYWLPALALGVLCIYFLMRGAGVIELPWLAIISGLACWVAAVGLLYIAHPARSTVTSIDREK